MRRCFFLALAFVGLVCEPARADFFTFANTTSMSIPSSGVASLYPSTIAVSHLQGSIANLTVSINGFNHSFPDDLGVVVVPPQGRPVLLFSGAGSNVRARDLSFVFDDNAAAQLPMTGALFSGTYKPGVEQWDDFFDAPGPLGKRQDSDPSPWDFEFSALKSQDPNGNWNLYVKDFVPGDSGSITRGWSITFQINAVPEPGSVLLLSSALLLGGGAARFRHRKKVSDLNTGV